MDRKWMNWCWRLLFYLTGLLLLAFGVCITNLADLGVAPFVSVHYGISRIWGLNFPALAFCVYLVLVTLQFVIKGRNRSWRDLLQVPFALLFSLLLEFFGRLLTFQPQGQSIPLFCLGILCTSVGSAMSVSMKLLPNPADGLCQTIAERVGKDLGTVRNIMDIACVAITCAIGMAAVGRVEVIGPGTLVSMVLSGRIIFLFNHFFKLKMDTLAGVAPAAYQS
ncbi:YitT family protein [uncultured Dysosmobacter sp.]|uniref:YczE/YyaS/YitT family protein n=1 Tax=uncultured Dysosmobacter sp. TaxID=2591384 RepID=UPI0026303467|nr:hypothetical protein [uncultured Dysosmobacter sp.]